MTVDRSNDCWTCGYPSLRMGGHADWCERVTARLALAPNGPASCPSCGNEFGNAGALGRHRTSKFPCRRPTSAAPDVARVSAERVSDVGDRGGRVAPTTSTAEGF